MSEPRFGMEYSATGVEATVARILKRWKESDMDAVNLLQDAIEYLSGTREYEGGLLPPDPDAALDAIAEAVAKIEGHRA